MSNEETEAQRNIRLGGNVEANYKDTREEVKGILFDFWKTFYDDSIVSPARDNVIEETVSKYVKLIESADHFATERTEKKYEDMILGLQTTIKGQQIMLDSFK